jgi:hypothetical protein
MDDPIFYDHARYTGSSIAMGIDPGYGLNRR